MENSKHTDNSLRAYSLGEAVAILEKLNDKSLAALLDVINTVLYKKKSDTVGVLTSDEIDNLLDSGVLVADDDPKALLGTYRRDELIVRLQASGYSGFKKNMKLEELICWICDNVSDVAALCQDAVSVRVSYEFARVLRKIHTYLKRRIENESYFDPERGEYVEIPYGSEFRAEISFTSQPRLVLSFPDDQITDLLDLYGVNRCRTWGNQSDK